MKVKTGIFEGSGGTLTACLAPGYLGTFTLAPEGSGGTLTAWLAPGEPGIWFPRIPHFQLQQIPKFLNFWRIYYFHEIVCAKY